MRVSEAFVEHVASSDRKLIVTLTSGMGSIADNTSGGSVVYRSSKAGVNMVMRSLAIDLAPRGITCVVVNPGWIRTGWAERLLRAIRKHQRAEASHPDVWARAIRQVLQSHWSRISLVA
jgi:NAD(P)-dependent dehydrogenase (short-subunit alcohol dehydrogenase family)